jgi:hypothetical protein
MTNAHWARPVKRLAKAPGAFIPVLFLLFWPLYFGREKLFSWIHDPVAGKEIWLDPEFLFVRDGLGLLMLSFVALALIFCSVRRDLKFISLQREKDPGQHRPPSESTISEMAQVDARGWQLQITLSPILGILYAVVLSLIAFDLIMSLDPHWLSTLFGAYYFVGSFYTALAALIVLSYLGMRSMGMRYFIQPKHFHDLGKLLFGFCIVTGDFFYSQFLVIWYGNLPEEAHYVILRVRHTPWESLAWSVLLICFVIPFLILLSRRIKLQPEAMLIIGCLIIVGMWLEKYLLIAPSLWEGGKIALGLPEILVSAGFLGAVSLTVLLFLKRFPLLPVSDPLFYEALDTMDRHK